MGATKTIQHKIISETMEPTLKNKNKMLNYCKAILEKMSFDRKLLLKEYRKSLKWLSESESQDLRLWMRSKMEASLASKNSK